MNEEISYQSWFPYELSNFQKDAISAITSDQHSLSCVPTGSGKTMPALFAIRYFHERGKRVIYTSPIKALSNQKFYEFSNTFPTISFGILTGDVKMNPDADVLIMTAEILQNKLTAFHSGDSYDEFEIDFKNDLGCVIHDEIHMINDQERGHVWENLIISIPSHIPMVLLSATLHNPSEFAKWIEWTNPSKKVCVSATMERAVPLYHYGFFTYPPSTLKKLNKQEYSEMTALTETFFEIQSPTTKFSTIPFDKMNKARKILYKRNLQVNRTFVLNEVCKQMYEKEMFPAVCFILSKRALLESSQQITTNILEFDSKIPYIIDRECESLLRSKLPNYKEFTSLPEYLLLLKLLRKGIAIHHAGMIPILRELVELLFEKGFVKLLFATETFSVGLNMPIKSTIFTDIFKFDGNGMRQLHSYEFVQASGRAGRRGKDVKGNVIHLFNLYRTFEISAFQNMMRGEPPVLKSKFKFSYRHVLSQQMPRISHVSMFKQDLLQKTALLEDEKNKISRQIEQYEVSELQTSENERDEFCRLQKKKSKKKNHLIQTFIEEHPTIQKDIQFLERFNNMKEERQILFQKEHEKRNLMETTFTNMSKWLHHHDFLNNQQKTRLGQIACFIEEAPCIVLSKLFDTFKLLSNEEILCYLSCFSSLFRNEESSNIGNHSLFPLLEKTEDMIQMCYSFEATHGIVTAENYDFHIQTIPIMEVWLNVMNEEDCHRFQQLLEEKNIFFGDWIKVLLKVQNLCRQLQTISKQLDDVVFLQKLEKMPPMLLKSVATSASLYI
jgi:antiviral helicase SKI2